MRPCGKLQGLWRLLVCYVGACMLSTVSAQCLDVPHVHLAQQFSGVPLKPLEREAAASRVITGIGPC